MTLKALSIKQPWAWLIVNGYKDVENRTWRTNHRGIFLVHAGKKFDKKGYEFVRRAFPKIPMPPPADFQRGGIVGQAELVDCFSSARAPDSLWYFGEVGFLLANPKPLPFYELPGKLGFFSVLGAIGEKVKKDA